MTSTAVQIPGYVVGTWDIDASHSTVGFSVRHMMVSKVRGYFTKFEGVLVTAEDPANSTVEATIDMDSIDTRQEQRDAHIRSADFFDVGNHTVMTFRSTEVRTDGADWTVVGDLTIKGITQRVELEAEFGGQTIDAFGMTRAGFEAKGEISRKDFNITWNAPLQAAAGGVLVSDNVKILIDASFVLPAEETSQA